MRVVLIVLCALMVVVQTLALVPPLRGALFRARAFLSCSRSDTSSTSTTSATQSTMAEITKLLKHSGS